MKTIIKKAEDIAQEAKRYLIEHLDDLELYEVDTHYVTYKLKIEKDWYENIKIWTANGEKCAKFYESVSLIKLEYIDYSDEERKILWDKAQSDKSQTGEKRNITMTQMRNDLYFNFKGVFGEVKFSGYNDTDWWTKYKPTAIQETEEITWQIDLDKNIATYKPR